MTSIGQFCIFIFLIGTIKTDKADYFGGPRTSHESDKIIRSYQIFSNLNNPSEGSTKTRSSHIQRVPYYRPFITSSGRISFYYPSQLVLINPGFPVDNPIHKRPNRPTTSRPPNLADRFGMNDDLPIWDQKPGRTTAAPPLAKPTRLPVQQADLPPLLHTEEKTQQISSVSNSVEKSAAPNQCVWAIVNCCSISNSKVLDSCFEQRGCPGPFWGTGPCHSDFARSALASALNYYNSGS